jgi:DNA-binding NarL/FixJ family response regulator
MSSPAAADAAPAALILQADRLYAQALHDTLIAIFPRATAVLRHAVAGAKDALRDRRFDLLLTDVGLRDGDVLELLARCTAGPDRVECVLVVTGRRELHTLETLRGLPINGVFDPTCDGLGEFAAALRTVVSGGHYWSASVLACVAARAIHPRSLCRILTAREQVVLAVIGEGCDDEQAAEQLGLRASAVHSMRRKLHRKLGINHRGELVRLAVQHGFVQFTPDGVMRPGFAQLLAACQRKERKVAGAAAEAGHR